MGFVLGLVLGLYLCLPGWAQISPSGWDQSLSPPLTEAPAEVIPKLPPAAVPAGPAAPAKQPFSPGSWLVYKGYSLFSAPFHADRTGASKARSGAARMGQGALTLGGALAVPLSEL